MSLLSAYCLPLNAMSYKIPLFFLVAFSILVYFDLFWKNRHEKVKFRLFGREAGIGLGLLLMTAFFDGALLSVLLLWLMGYISA